MIKRMTMIILVCIAIVALSLPVWAQDDSGLLTERNERGIEQALRTLTLSDDVPGAFIYIDSPDLTYSNASGSADIDAQTPIEPDDAYRIGSATKMFTGVLMMQLQEEGVLSVDDKLADWLPEIAANLAYGDDITLRHLMTHTAGVPNYTGVDESHFDPTGDGYIRDWTPDEIVPLIYDTYTPFEPGREDAWAYSNTHYILLGMVIEAATGQDIATLYRERIFEPLGMAHTYTPPQETGDLINGYTLLGEELVTTEIWNPSFAWTAGAIVSTAPDMTRFLRGLGNGDLFQNDDTLALMMTGVNAGWLPARPGDYGLGLMVSGDIIGHNGGTPGFVSLAFYNTETDTALILFANSDRVPPLSIAAATLQLITILDT